MIADFHLHYLPDFAILIPVYLLYRVMKYTLVSILL